MEGYDSQHVSDEALVGVQSPKELSKRLKQLNLREKLEVKLWDNKIWPVLPLFVKAEINPILTIVEEITTWIVLISWAQVVLFGSAISPFVGGIALFVALTILHYWYGTFSTPETGNMGFCSVTDQCQ